MNDVSSSSCLWLGEGEGGREEAGDGCNLAIDSWETDLVALVCELMVEESRIVTGGAAKGLVRKH
ncbi:hypothetical protein SERLA73DRAFT_127336 [Serpula lacrymans var. lacrymans S7.3]|uniref:Uncharacterized protein n=2 Tax=Serpula lacrymans var. lacrymans TaxID=341189 RepID=F8QGD4_SERL3|nr:uncharacterized protein SERLADRAFT_366451 [Serpula lacrymans var. lacrymans S7.9]EGN92612.1 hypothetical protein SERLA73DRAFT_127336 [Serpula lacrymans var. lacrymans S7.3]EGO28755.1 hypothetical protein SERLADRAFT_366451 [Serpula lacrymans var. lacrymans S7.9]